MLSTQTTMCLDKDAVLNQMYQLMNKLQGLQQQAVQRIITHKALADAANQAWLSAEAQYQTEVKAETNDNTLFQNELKVVSNDQSQVNAQQDHVAVVFANVTSETADATNDEAIIKLILSELSTLTAMPVRSPSYAVLTLFFRNCKTQNLHQANQHFHTD